jgi:hypothetical protein
LRAWLTTFAPILISFSRSVVINQSLIGSGVASVRRKLPTLLLMPDPYCPARRRSSWTVRTR